MDIWIRSAEQQMIEGLDSEGDILARRLVVAAVCIAIGLIIIIVLQSLDSAREMY